VTNFSVQAAGNTLLSYSVGTDPEPLQVSPTNGTSNGALTIVVSNPSTAQYIYVQSISFSFPEGSGAQALTNIDTGMTTGASPSSQWQLAQTGVGTFTATPVSGNYVQMGTNGAVFEIFGIVINTTAGNVTLSIIEMSSTTTSGFTAKNGTSIIAKFPYGFFFSNLTPSAPSVNDGQSVVLTWEASDGPTYTMFYPGGQADVTELRAWTSPALHNVTTFLLQAASQQGGQTVITSLTTTVIVQNGEVTLTSLNVTNNVQMVGAPQSLPAPVSTGTPASQSYTAPTDGLVIGFVGANASASPTLLSVGFITIQNSTGVYASATGGNFLAYVQQNPPPAPQLQFSQSSFNQSIALPVRSGESFSLTVQFEATNQATPQAAFWYIPLGSGQATASQVQASQAKAMPPVLPPAMLGTVTLNG
jgi:hypothetical protein